MPDHDAHISHPTLCAELRELGWVKSMSHLQLGYDCELAPNFPLFRLIPVSHGHPSFTRTTRLGYKMDFLIYVNSASSI